jgi:ABC-2 type transport system permease protein
MIAYLFTSAFRDFLRPARFALWVLVGLVVGMMSYYLANVMQSRDAMGQYGQLASLFAFRVVALAAAIFGSNVISQEIEQKTIVYLITRPIPRWQLILSRGLAAGLVTWIVSLPTLVGVAIAVRDVGPFNSVVLRDAGALFLGAYAYTALFIFVTLLVNKAMLWNLVFAFGWEVAVPNMGGSTYFASINTYVQGLAAHSSNIAQQSVLRVIASQNSAQGVGAGASLAVLLGLIVAFTAAYCYWFSTHEYIPREDSD